MSSSFVSLKTWAAPSLYNGIQVGRALVYGLCWALGKPVLLGNCHQMEINVYAMNWKLVCVSEFCGGR